jgi:hypothetical protein
MRSKISEKKQPTGDYETGYCRPPKYTRFQKGRSVKRTGRRSRNRNLLNLFKEIVAETVRARDGENVRIMTTGEAVLAVNQLNALKGDQKAMHNCFMLAEEAQLFTDLTDLKQTGGFLFVPQSMTLEEWEALTAYQARHPRKKD